MSKDCCSKIRGFIKNCCKKNSEFVKTIENIIIWSLGLGLYVFLLWMCIVQIRESNHPIQRELPPKNLPQKLFIDIQSNNPSGKADSIVINKLDTVISVIGEWNTYREENISQGLNNLRQETNNVIEKQNAWLAFWIAILAIVGALIPALLQWRNERKLDSELEKINELQDKIDKRIDNIKDTIDDNIKNSEIYQLSNTLISVIENIRFINLNDRTIYINMLLDELYIKTREYFYSLRTTERNIDITHLRNVLLQLLSAYNVCRQLPVGRYKNRQLSMITNSINLILANLFTNTGDQGQRIANNQNRLLERLLERMNTFRI